MKTFRLAALTAPMALFAIVLLTARCGGDPSAPTFRYAGSGTDWQWTLTGDGHFTARELTTTTHFSGTFVRLESGFVKLMMGAPESAGAPAAGTVRYGLEIPGVAFLVQALLPGERGVIVNVAAGSCPSADFKSNWILTQYSPLFDMSQPAAKVFGTFQWSQSSSAGTLPDQYAIAGNFQSNGPDNTPITGTCSDGKMSADIHGAPGTIYLAQNGGAVVKFHDETGILALPAAPIGATASLAGAYAGLVVNLNDLFPVRAVQGSIDSTGRNVRVDGLFSVDPAIVDGGYHGTATLDALDAPGPGFAEVTVTTGNGQGKMACMISVNLLGSGKNLFFCAGEAPGVSYNRYAYNVLLVSK